MRSKPGCVSEEDLRLTCGSEGKRRQRSAWLHWLSESEEGWRVTYRCWDNWVRGCPPIKGREAGCGKGSRTDALRMQNIQRVLGCESLAVPIDRDAALQSPVLRTETWSSMLLQASCGVVSGDLPGSSMWGGSRIWGQDTYLWVTREQRILSSGDTRDKTGGLKLTVQKRLCEEPG